MVKAVIPLAGVPLEEIRQRKLEATQRLLGATIAISDEDWQMPTRLPGWTRAHVATHLSRGADALRRVSQRVLHGTDEPMYGPDREWEIERGSERSALDLQIDLDTSAGRLHDLFDEADGVPGFWDRQVTLHCGLLTTMASIPLVRLWEVTTHLVDLGVGFSIQDVPDDEATWLLGLQAARMEAHGSRPLTMAVDDDLRYDVAGGGPEVAGSAQALLGWVTGRWPDAPVRGHVVLPE